MMEELRFEIRINSPKTVVWNTLIDAKKYKEWAKAFSPNSYFEGEWKQGTFINFLDPNMGGTKAVLETIEPYCHILAKHVSIISNEGNEDTTGEMAKKWIGTSEEYTLIEEEGETLLVIEIKTHSDFKQMFNEGWPKALQAIKELSE